jgi:hypothetical protein
MPSSIRRAIQSITRFVLALLLTLPAVGQTWVHTNEVGVVGTTVHDVSTTFDLYADPARCKQIWSLDPRFTTAGFKCVLHYTITPLNDNGYAAAPKIQVLTADGICLHSREVNHYTHTVLSGSLKYYGENHLAAKPDRIRFTFAQSISGAYRVSARLVVKPEMGANTGGPLREGPKYMFVGTNTDPAWDISYLSLTGEYLYLPGDRRDEFHRFLIFYLQGGQALYLRTVTPALSGVGFTITMWDLNHRELAVFRHSMPAAATNDSLLYQNPSNKPMFIITAMGTNSPFYGTKFGYWSPQGQSPAPGQNVPKPTGTEVNPYVLVGGPLVQTVTPALGVVTRFHIPGHGAMTRLRMRVVGKPYLFGYSGGGMTVEIKNIYNQVLARADAGGHSLAKDEVAFERDFHYGAALEPAFVDVVTGSIYSAPQEVTFQAERFGRIR